MPTDRLDRVEERIAWLERHVAEQDKAMLEFAAQISLLQKELLALRDRSAGGQNAGADPSVDDDRPPHY